MEKGESVEEMSVSEIHGYPLRPAGFEEPLFPGAASRRVVAEHLLRAPWLVRASELVGRGGQAVHARREPVELRTGFAGGRVQVVGSSGCGRRRQGWVTEVLARWREVGEWWDEDRTIDRGVVRVVLSDGAVVDLARESGNPGGWFLVGVVD